MLVCEAFVDTDRAQRYVDQLAKHFVHQPGGIRAQSQGDGQLLVDFGWGTCNMRPQPDGLLLRAEAPDAEKLGWIQRGVADRLVRIGRRDRLVVRWSAATAE